MTRLLMTLLLGPSRVPTSSSPKSCTSAPRLQMGKMRLPSFRDHCRKSKACKCLKGRKKIEHKC
jgi:hypothetical protein